MQHIIKRKSFPGKSLSRTCNIYETLLQRTRVNMYDLEYGNRSTFKIF